MPRPKSRGRCSCGHRFRPPTGEPIYFDEDGNRLPPNLQIAAARTNVAARFGGTSHLGICIFQAVIENA